MPGYCVVDTTVVQKANAPLKVRPRARSQFVCRLRLLERIHAGHLLVMVSDHLLAEYQRQLPQPRNDYVRAFFELVSNPGRVVPNWKRPWGTRHREQARHCRYPREDEHVLRTAVRADGDSTIFTEERRQLKADTCIHRVFHVRIEKPN